MSIYFRICLLGSLIAFSITACSQPKNETIIIKAAEDPLDGIRTVLDGYVKGQPIRSEASSFPNYINDIRKVSPEKADILEKGLEELQKPGANVQGKAKALLEKLE
ncbi:MAG: hypothetical protein WCN64_09230 [Planctomycetota bacterium]